jgi:hypothetical protein
MNLFHIAAVSAIILVTSACAPGGSASNGSTAVTSPASTPVVPTATGLDLDPVPFYFAPPIPENEMVPGWESKLTTSPVADAWADELAAAGVRAAVNVFYNPDSGDAQWLMAVYYMPESIFDAGMQDVLPVYGNEISRSNGFVMSVEGPQGALFEPGSEDENNIQTLNTLIYDSANYLPY